jgi:hypothetical protein
MTSFVDVYLILFSASSLFVLQPVLVENAGLHVVQELL